ncbi:hypothetical protein Hanom_Chr01g00086641 [Helianthus anomalus]
MIPPSFIFFHFLIHDFKAFPFFIFTNIYISVSVMLVWRWKRSYIVFSLNIS